MCVQNNTVTDEVGGRFDDLTMHLKATIPELQTLEWIRSPRTSWAMEEMKTEHFFTTDIYKAYRLWVKEKLPIEIRDLRNSRSDIVESLLVGEWSPKTKETLQKNQWPKFDKQVASINKQIKEGDRKIRNFVYLGRLKERGVNGEMPGDLTREQVLKCARERPASNSQRRPPSFLERVRSAASVVFMTTDMALYRRDELLQGDILFICDESFRVSHAEDAAIESILPLRRIWLGSPERLAPFDPSPDSGVDEKLDNSISCAERTFINAKKMEMHDQVPRVFELTSSYRFCPDMIKLLDAYLCMTWKTPFQRSASMYSLQSGGASRQVPVRSCSMSWAKPPGTLTSRS